MTSPLPTFLVIGAPRAGTTALHQWLGRHPDVCMSRPKETQFFSLDVANGVGHYAGFFRHYAGEPAIGESTPMYLTLPHVPARIAALLPDVALIAVLRNPVDQAYSSWWMMRCLGVERRPFAQAVADERSAEPLAADDAQAYWGRLLDAAEHGRAEPDARYLMTGHYTTALQRYRTHFDDEQLTVVLHDDLVTAPASVTSTIARAVGIDPGRASSPHPPRVNSSTGRAEAWMARRSAGIPSARARRALRRGARLLDRGGPPPLAQDARRELTTYFAHVNAELPALVGRDLSAWFPDQAAHHG